MTELAEPEVMDNAITFLNMTGDITITWDGSNDERIKELVRKKMKEGYSFFSMKKVVIETVKIRRKVGINGVAKLDNLVIDDDTFEKLVKGIDDRDLADTLRLSAGKLAKRTDRDASKKHFAAGKRLGNADEVVQARQALAVKPIRGG